MQWVAADSKSASSLRSLPQLLLNFRLNLNENNLSYIFIYLFADEASKFDYRVDSPDEDFLDDLEDALNDNELANVQNSMAEPLPEPGFLSVVVPAVLPHAINAISKIRFGRRRRRRSEKRQ